MCYFKASDRNDGHLSRPVLSAQSKFIILSTLKLQLVRNSSRKQLAQLGMTLKCAYLCNCCTEAAAEQLSASTMPRSYHSPWEQEILGDPSLAETIKLRMPAPDPRPNLPEYKSFNRWGHDNILWTTATWGCHSSTRFVTGWPLPSAALIKLPKPSPSRFPSWT